MSPAVRGGSGVGELFLRGWRLIAGAPKSEAPPVERRASKRVQLRLPVHTCVPGGRFEEGSLIDVSLRGLAMDSVEGAQPGEPISVRLRSGAAGVPSFVLNGSIVRTLAPHGDGVGVDFSRGDNPPEALANFRKLVLFYLRRRPLMDELNGGTLEGRCTSCEWTGRLGRRESRCPACGQAVEPLGT